ncbi:MAG: hypothetical protein WAM39_14815 [Bryobacteraceae bacterium]
MASEPQSEETQFEPSDINARAVLVTAASVIVGVWVIVSLLYFCFAYLVHERTAASPPPLPIEAHGNPMPPYPRLQSSPARDLKTLRASEDWELGHYYWIDKSKGIVAIPIERAIEILAERGIPPQKAPSSLTLSQPQAGTRQTGFEGKVEPEPR